MTQPHPLPSSIRIGVHESGAAGTTLTSNEVATLRQSEHSWKINYRATMDVNAQLRAENAVLRHALEPFTRVRPHKSEKGNSGILIPATIAEVRCARAALSGDIE
jgi:hypothetical protein